MVTCSSNKDGSSQHTGESLSALNRVVPLHRSVVILSSLFSSLLIYYYQGLLSAPNPDDPLDNNVAEHWKRNEADAMVKGERITKYYDYIPPHVFL